MLQTHRSAVSSQKIIVFGLFFRFSTALLITALLGRFLTPSEYGFFSLLTMLAIVSKDILELGVSNLATREIVREPANERKLLEGLTGWRLVASSIIMVVLIAFAFTQETSLRFYLVLGLAIVTPSYIVLAQVPVFQARQAILGPTLLGVGLQSVFIIALISLQSAGLGGILLCWLIILRELASNIGYHILSRRLLSYTPGIGKLDTYTRKFLARALIFSGAILLHGLYFHSDVLIVYWLRGSAELGAYAASFRAINVALDLPYMLMMPLVPVLTVLAASADKFRDLVGKLAVVSLAMGLAGTVAGILTARDILEVLYGEKYIVGAFDSTGAFAWQSVALSATCLGAPLAMALLALHRESSLLVIAATGFLLNVVANLILVPRFGFEAAAIATAATECLVACLMLAALCRAVGMVMKPVWLAAPIPAAALGLGVFLIDLPPLPRFGLAALMGILTIGVILLSSTAKSTRKQIEEAQRSR